MCDISLTKGIVISKYSVAADKGNVIKIGIKSYL